MASWLDTVIQGVLLGGLYALFAAGLALAFGIMRLVNIAHGDFIVLAAFMLYGIGTWLGIGPLGAALVVAPLMAGLGYLLQRRVLNRVSGSDPLPSLLVTFGLSVIIQNALLALFSADARRLGSGGIETASLAIGDGHAVGVLPLVTFAAAVAVIGASQWLLFHTSLGRAFRATSDDPQIARLMGVNPGHVYAIAMAVSMMMIVVAAALMGTRSTFAPADGPARLLIAFEVVIIGGLGSLWGALAGGIILGVAQTVGFRFDAGWGTLAGHLVFFAVLIARPEGLFPRTRDR